MTFVFAWVERMTIMKASVSRVLVLAEVEVVKEPEQLWGRTMDQIENFGT
jgi:hypothetical protein